MQSAGQTGRSSSLLHPPPTIGRYEILERVGFGGMAEVYKGRLVTERGAEKIVAVKKILPQLADDAQFRSMFIHEAKIAFSLSHRNIVSVFDQGEEEGFYYLVMDFIEGHDLAKMLHVLQTNGEGMPEPLAVFIASEVLAALEYAHSRRDGSGRHLNIIHRDVSPSNIYISYDGEVKLGDFGIAKISSNPGTSVHGVKGKWSYMAPEQARGENLDARSDLFSLGVTLYELVTASKLFDEENEMKLLEAVRAARIPDLATVCPTLSPELRAILTRTLQARPEDRYASASELEEELRGILHKSGSQRWNRKLGKFLKDLIPIDRKSSPDPRAEVSEDPASSRHTRLLESNRRPAMGWKTPAVALIALLVGVSASIAALRWSTGQGWHGPEATRAGMVSEEAAAERAGHESEAQTALAPEPQPTTDPSTESPASLPRRPEPQWAFLNINSTPWAHVTLDGRPLDKTTPLMQLKVSAGKHVLELTNPYVAGKKSVEILVRPDETKSIVVDLTAGTGGP